jgi:hypothetical protein
MSREEHYFENLIKDGNDDGACNQNRDTISPEVREVIEMCYEYVVRNIFKSRKNLDNFFEDSEG